MKKSQYIEIKQLTNARRLAEDEEFVPALLIVRAAYRAMRHGYHEWLHQLMAIVYRCAIGISQSKNERNRLAEALGEPAPTNQGDVVRVCAEYFMSNRGTRKVVQKRARVLAWLADQGCSPDEVYERLRRKGVEKLSREAAAGAQAADVTESEKTAGASDTEPSRRDVLNVSFSLDIEDLIEQLGDAKRAKVTVLITRRKDDFVYRVSLPRIP